MSANLTTTATIASAISYKKGFSGFSGTRGATGGTGGASSHNVSTVYITTDNADDPALRFYAGTPNKIYKFRAVLYVTTTANTGINFQVLSSIQQTNYVFWSGYNIQDVGFTSASVTFTFNTTLTVASSAKNILIIEGQISLGNDTNYVGVGIARAGGFGSVTLKAGSRLEYQELP